MEDFYMVLSSNGCGLTQPDNTASHFINDWENPTLFYGSWKVAMTEFHSTYNIEPSTVKEGMKISWTDFADTVKQDAELIIESKDKWNFVDTGGIKFDGKFDGDRFKFYLWKKFYFVIHMTDEVAKILGFNETEVKSTVDYKGMYTVTTDRPITVPCDVKFFVTIHPPTPGIDKTFIVKEDKLFLRAQELFNYLSENVHDAWSSITTNDDGKVEIKLSWKCYKLVIDREFAMVLGFSNRTFYNPLEHTDLPYISNSKLNLTPNYNEMVYIYSDIAQPIMVGGNMRSFLRAFWINTKEYKYGDSISYVVDRPMYIPLAASTINNIEIDVTTNSGKYIPFDYGTVTSVTLHFVKYE